MINLCLATGQPHAAFITTECFRPGPLPAPEQHRCAHRRQPYAAGPDARQARSGLAAGGRLARRCAGADERTGAQTRPAGFAVAGRAARAHQPGPDAPAEPRAGPALQRPGRAPAATLRGPVAPTVPAHRNAAVCRRFAGPGAPRPRCPGPGPGAEDPVPGHPRDLRRRPAATAPSAAARPPVPRPGRTAGSAVYGITQQHPRRTGLPGRAGQSAAFLRALRRLAGPASATAGARAVPPRRTGAA